MLPPCPSRTVEDDCCWTLCHYCGVLQHNYLAGLRLRLQNHAGCMHMMNCCVEPLQWHLTSAVYAALACLVHCACLACVSASPKGSNGCLCRLECCRPVSHGVCESTAFNPTDQGTQVSSLSLVASFSAEAVLDTPFSARAISATRNLASCARRCKMNIVRLISSSLTKSSKSSR